MLNKRHMKQWAIVLGLASFAASGRAAAQGAVGSLPGGASALRENHGDWVVTCATDAQSGKVCTLSQEQADGRTRQRVLAVELRPSQATVQGMLVMPFGLALDQGISLQIDEAPAEAPRRFRTCLPTGCLVPLSFDEKALGNLRKGTALKIKATADGGKETSFSISLKGFPSALERTIALSK